MSVLVLPKSVRSSVAAIETASETAPAHKLVQTAIFYLIGEISEDDVKIMSRKAQVAFPTFLEAIECLSWILCEAVRCKCTVDQFREFIAEFDFLNTPETLEVYRDNIGTILQCLKTVAPDSDHFISCDWRVQVEISRRSIRSTKRPHVILDLKTQKSEHILEATPAMLIELHEQLDQALQACRTAQFRRIQRFVK